MCYTVAGTLLQVAWAALTQVDHKLSLRLPMKRIGYVLLIAALLHLGAGIPDYPWLSPWVAQETDCE